MPESDAPIKDASGALALESRRRIFDFVRRTPGAHLREIQRALGMPYGTAEYHLRALEEAGLLRGSPDGNLKRYFAADFAFADREVLGLLRKRAVRAVVVALLERGELTHQELAAAAGIKPPTLSYHLPRLEAAHIVEARRDGRFTRMRLKDPNLMAKLLVTHGRSFADGAVDRFLATWSGFQVPPGSPGTDGRPAGEGGPAEGAGDRPSTSPDGERTEGEEKGVRPPRGN